MHMRRKAWAIPELEACPYFIPRPEDMRGRWHGRFPHPGPMHLELGCGKGVSTAKMAFDSPTVNYVAIDVSSNVLGSARRNLAAEYGDRPVDNVLITLLDIGYIEKYFAPEDTVERIYINFCNPWSQRKKHAKRRLTHPRQLAQYRAFLPAGGEIWFKTDDDALFADSLLYFEQTGFTVRYRTDDLHGSGFQPNYVSEHEARFCAQGLPIHFLIAVRREGEIPPPPIR